MSKSNNQSNTRTSSNNSKPAILSPGSTRYKTIITAFYYGIYNVDNPQEVYREASMWLEEVLEAALSEGNLVIREPLFAQAKITRFLETASHLRAMALGKEPEDKGVYVNQVHIKDIINAYNKLNSKKANIGVFSRLFSAFVPIIKPDIRKPETLNMLAFVMETEAVKHCLQLFISNKGNLALHEFKTFKDWCLEQNFLKGSKLQIDEKKFKLAYQNYINNYIYKENSKGIQLFDLPDDIISSIDKYLLVEDSIALNFPSKFSRYHYMQNITETLHCKPKSQQDLKALSSDESRARNNLEFLDLRNPYFSSEDFEKNIEEVRKFTNLKNLKLSMSSGLFPSFWGEDGSMDLSDKVTALNLSYNGWIPSIQTFKNLKTLHFSNLHRKEHFDELCKVIFQEKNASFKGIAIKISGINQNWTTFDKAKKLLQDNQNLSLSFKSLNVAQNKTSYTGGFLDVPTLFFEEDSIYKENSFWPKGVTELVIPERFHCDGVFCIIKVPKLKKIRFPKGISAGKSIVISGNPNLRNVIFSEKANLGGAIVRIESNKSLSNVVFGRGRYTSEQTYGAIEIVDNSALTKIALPKNTNCDFVVIARNKALETLYFPERLVVYKDMRILRNKKLRVTNFANDANIRRTLSIIDNPLFDTITYSKDISVVKLFLGNHNPKLLTSLSQGTNVKEVHLRQSEYNQANFFFLLLLNEKLKSENLYKVIHEVYGDRLEKQLDQKWFDLRDKILKIAEDPNTNIASDLSNEEIALVEEGMGNIDAYLAEYLSGNKITSKQPKIEILERLSVSIRQNKSVNDNNNNKNSVPDNIEVDHVTSMKPKKLNL